MGFNEYEDDHLLKICKVGVDDFVGSHPGGYDSNRWRGVGLSGGQRQTINLARSLPHDPKIRFLMNQCSWIKERNKKW